MVKNLEEDELTAHLTTGRRLVLFYEVSGYVFCVILDEFVILLSYLPPTVVFAVKATIIDYVSSFH